MSSINEANWQGLATKFAETSAADEHSTKHLSVTDDADLPPALVADRRHFLRLMSASMALAGVAGSGCRRWPVEEVLPHSSRPEGFAPGVAQWYASCFELGGVATGILAKSYDGRPIKVDGNPEHPYSHGASTAIMQASILELYDPERQRQVLQRVPRESTPIDQAPNSPPKLKITQRSWEQFESSLAPELRTIRQQAGSGLAILLQPTSSPTVQRLAAELQAALPQAKWFYYEPLHRDHEYEGCRKAFGKVLRPQYHFEQAKRIVAFDADPLGTHPAALRLARDWAIGRRNFKTDEMNRLYAIEPSFTVTGSVADQRLALSASRIGSCVTWLAQELGCSTESSVKLTETEQTWMQALLRDLQGHIGQSIVMVGSGQPADVHHLVWAINDKLQNLGRTIELTEEPLAELPNRGDSIRDLSNLLQGNAIRTLIIVGGNPVYDSPVDTPLDLSSTPQRPLTSIHLSLYDNETSRQCSWSCPASHFLEAWGDGRAWDGTYTLQQPLILPLHRGRSPIEFLQFLLGVAANGREAVQATFRTLPSAPGLNSWEQAVRTGLVSQSRYALASAPAVRTATSLFGPTSDWEVNWVADRKVWDGRFANNAWLQEFPDPLTKLTWDNAALISKADADNLGVGSGDWIEIEFANDRSDSEPASAAHEKRWQIPVLIMPGQAAKSLTIPLGYGRVAGGYVGRDIGFNAYPVRTSHATYTAAVQSVKRVGKHHALALTMEETINPGVATATLETRLGAKGKPGLLVREALLSDYERDHRAVHGSVHEVHAAPLYDSPHGFDTPHKWGMTIDLNACLGCGGCTIACQAENNIPVVGKDNVINHREMHWLRIDRYFKGSVDDPDVVHVPVTCMHCETAPCEQVCPVAATVHDSEGLNAMVYNRCIGTRYCANNCPFKVRRFNYFDYQSTHPRTPPKPWLSIPDEQPRQEISPLHQLMFNPDVTVRMRGIMEKCTYCVQRIVPARVRAKNEYLDGKRELPVVSDGEVQTACQAACPTQAIRFGDLNDADSQVAQAHKDNRHYEMLAELNLRSRTTYLAKIRNR